MLRYLLLLSLLVTLPVTNASAASCCGGGGGANVLAPKFAAGLLDATFSDEVYDGYWDGGGSVQSDPPGSDLRQYRLDLSYAKRIAGNWQMAFSLPLVYNRNSYAGLDTSTSGVGDTSLSFWYEAFDNITCVYKVEELADLKPALYWGATLTLPTGVSPYDSVGSSFDVTGRGFYRLDLNAIIEKTVYPWTATINVSYGAYRERKVNREYGAYVEPYSKTLGRRSSASFAVGYTHFFAAASTVTATGTYAYLEEESGTIDGANDFASGMKKRSVTFALAYADSSGDLIFKGSYNHSLRGEQNGENFPITDIFSLGVSYALR